MIDRKASDVVIKSNLERSANNFTIKNEESSSAAINQFIPKTEVETLTFAEDSPIIYKTISSVLKKNEITKESNSFPDMDCAFQKDERQLVQNMRQTIGPGFATAGLVMAAKSQVEFLDTQIGITNPECSEESQENPEINSFFFEVVYMPFMEILFKGNSDMSTINDHARTVSPSERCFFCILILVTFIYAFGILTAVILLSSMLWYA